jgi:hypothetical protein
MYVKLSGTLIVHKALSKLVPYESKLCFKLSSVFLCASHF